MKKEAFSMLTPRENFVRFLKKENYEWIPSSADMLRIMPAAIPGFVARGLVFQQNPYTGQFGGKDLFGVDWYYDAPARGSMEKAPLLSDPDDLENWEEHVHFTDLSSLDWEGCAAENAEYLKTDKIIYTTIYSGFFERLISFVGFENAAMALIDEDQQPAVHRLFSALADYYIELIGYFHRYFNVELVALHDDWGTQISTMFSVETHTEMILPYIKRVVDGAHAIGVYFEQHSCGKIEKLVPNIIASGADTWRGQNINDKKMLVDTYGDSFLFGVDLAPTGSTSLSDEDGRTMLSKIFEQYKGKNVWYGFTRQLGPQLTKLATELLKAERKEP